MRPARATLVAAAIVLCGPDFIVSAALTAAAPRGTDVRRTRASTVSRFLFLAAADGTEGSAIATAVSTAPAAATPAALPAVLRTAPLAVPSAATPPTEPPAPATAPGFACGAKSSAPMPRDSLLSAPVS